MRGDKLFIILLMILISFFSAFTVGLNKYAIQVYRDKIQVSRMIIISEIMVHGLSGLLIGLVSTRFISDVYTLCAVSGIGGMVGRKLLYVVANNLIASITNIKSVDISNIDNNVDDKPDK